MRVIATILVAILAIVFLVFYLFDEFLVTKKGSLYSSTIELFDQINEKNRLSDQGEKGKFFERAKELSENGEGKEVLSLESRKTSTTFESNMNELISPLSFLSTTGVEIDESKVLTFPRNHSEIHSENEETKKDLRRTSIDLFDTCPPFNYSFDDPEMWNAVGKAEDFNCTKIDLLTILENGVLHLNTEFLDYEKYDCKARCAFYGENYANRNGDWCDFTKTNCTYECDVIEVNCMKDGKFEYIFAHLQIYEYNRDRKKVFGNLYKPGIAPKIDKKHYYPDVHIMLLDSMGLFSMLRQMPKTVRFLRNELEAVTFERYTRTAADSKSNMLAGFFGEIDNDVDRSTYGGTFISQSLPKNECELALDDRNFISFEYEDAGYTTMHANDDYLVTFGFLECVGVKSQIATHYLRPLNLIEMIKEDTWSLKPILRHSWKNDDLLKKYQRNASLCHTPHLHALDYAGKFYKAYKGKPKMSITWMGLAHNDERHAHEADRFYAEFLREHKEELDNSFLIMMADHGQRLNDAAKTKQGQHEANIPAMFFSFPKPLRASKLHKIAESNSKTIVTHHDLYATLLDIVRHQAIANYTETDYRKIEKTFGSSWLREFDENQARSCKNLPISSQYCTCFYGMKRVNRKDRIWKRIYWTLDDDMNAELEKAGLEKSCKKIVVKTLNEVYMMNTGTNSTFYHVLFESVTAGIFVIQYELMKEDKLRPSPREWKRLNAFVFLCFSLLFLAILLRN